MEGTTNSEYAREESFIRVGILVNLPPLLESLGCDPEAVFESAGMRLNVFENPGNRISYQRASKVLEKSVTESGCDHLGLLLGQHHDLAYTGAAGFAALSARNVGQALETLSRFLDLSDEGGSLTIKRAGAYVKLGYLIHEKDVLATEHINDMTMAASYKAMKNFCGMKWKPAEVWLSRKRPENSQPYRQYFCAPLVFDAPENALVFHSRYLGQPLPSANPGLYRFLLDLIAESESISQQNLQRELASHISVGLLDNEISLGDIAQQIGIHPRTLNRRLKDLGTSFREIRESIRRTTACNLLRNTDMPISEVAVTLGYSGSSSFNHAFRRWKGMSPRVWRKQQMAADGERLN